MTRPAAASAGAQALSSWTARVGRETACALLRVDAAAGRTYWHFSRVEYVDGTFGVYLSAPTLHTVRVSVTDALSWIRATT